MLPVRSSPPPPPCHRRRRRPWPPAPRTKPALSRWRRYGSCLDAVAERIPRGRLTRSCPRLRALAHARPGRARPGQIRGGGSRPSIKGDHPGRVVAEGPMFVRMQSAPVCVRACVCGACDARPAVACSRRAWPGLCLRSRADSCSLIFRGSDSDTCTKNQKSVSPLSHAPRLLGWRKHTHTRTHTHTHNSNNPPPPPPSTTITTTTTHRHIAPAHLVN